MIDSEVQVMDGYAMAKGPCRIWNAENGNPKIWSWSGGCTLELRPDLELGPGAY
jgi:hypothetical protein